jgi:hypothetical protein
MIPQISTAAVAKISPKPDVPCIPSYLPIKTVPGGVSSRGRYELLSQVEGPEGSIAERLAAQVEDALQWEGWRPLRPLLTPLPVRLKLPLAFPGPAGPSLAFGRPWRRCCCCGGLDLGPAAWRGPLPFGEGTAAGVSKRTWPGVLSRGLGCCCCCRRCCCCWLLPRPCWRLLRLCCCLAGTGEGVGGSSLLTSCCRPTVRPACRAAPSCWGVTAPGAAARAASACCCCSWLACMGCVSPPASSMSSSVCWGGCSAPAAARAEVAAAAAAAVSVAMASGVS